MNANKNNNNIIAASSAVASDKYEALFIFVVYNLKKKYIRSLWRIIDPLHTINPTLYFVFQVATHTRDKETLDTIVCLLSIATADGKSVSACLYHFFPNWRSA